MLRTVAIDLCQGEDNQGDLQTVTEKRENSATLMDKPEVDDKQASTSKRKKDSDSEHSPGDGAKKTEKKKQLNESDEPKPRIVLTFRSEKPGLKSSNMKIVSTEEKHEEVSPRRLTRARGPDSDTHDEEHDSALFTRKLKSQGQSESDEVSSDSATTPLKRLNLRRTKEYSDNVLANAIARKEKSYNETTATSTPTQRLSRRIKPTAKILANKELRIGLETQNNVRLGIMTTGEKPDEGIQTRRSARRKSLEVPTMTGSSSSSRYVQQLPSQDDDLEGSEINQDQETSLNKLKKKHLSKLGLKEVDGQGREIILNASADTANEDSNTKLDHSELAEADCIAEENEDVEEVIEEEHSSGEDSELPEYASQFSSDCSEEYVPGSRRGAPAGPPRRSPRKNYQCLSASPQYSPPHEEIKEQRRRSVRRDRNVHVDEEISGLSNSEHSDEEIDDNADPSSHHSSKKRLEESMEYEDDIGEQNKDAPRRSLRKRKRLHYETDEYESMVPPGVENSEPASGDEGSEAVCPEEATRVLATCYCETPSNIYVTPSEVIEPVFCRAVESVEGARVGCSHAAARAPDGSLAALRRAGPRAVYFLACALHARQLAAHMCCPACGVFCTQGTFYQCSEGHLFHLECGLPYGGGKAPPGCPHCGIYSYRWQPRNRECFKVKVEMSCSNKRVLLPEQRVQCTTAYLGFSTLSPEQLESEPIVPAELLRSLPVDVEALCRAAASRAPAPGAPPAPDARALCDAIEGGAGVEDLVPMITSGVDVNRALARAGGGTLLHVAARRAHVAAVCALHCAGAALDLADGSLRTPLLVAVMTLLDKSQTKSDETDQSKDADADVSKDADVKVKVGTKMEDEGKVDKELLTVIRYLVAAGCDVNYAGQEGTTALHACAARGGAAGAAAAAALLAGARAAVDSRDAGGWSPLVWAAEHRHADLVGQLLSAGADAGASDAEGNAVLHWCALAGDAACLRRLLAAAPPRALDALNAHGDTPLHVAARQNHYPCVVILLARGARTDIENAEGELALEVSAGDCQKAIALNMRVAAARGAAHAQRLLAPDISNGREPNPIPCINDVDDAPAPDDFTYVTQHVMPHSIFIDNTIATLQGCECKGSECGGGAAGAGGAEGCACCALSVRRWWWRGRLAPAFPYHEPPMLFECNHTCGCHTRQCANSVVGGLSARGATFVRAQVFRAGGARGWALRAAAGAAVARGSPVATYCGELLAVAVADARSRDHYMFSLDLKPDLLEQCEDKTQLCVDAAAYGSAARFINHSCRPNLAPVRVFTTTRDLRLPTIVLFATRDIQPLEEFTFDYGDKFWLVKSKWMSCECGTPECRYPTKLTVEEDV